LGCRAQIHYFPNVADFDHFAADGYAVGINIILYALTH